VLNTKLLHYYCINNNSGLSYLYTRQNYGLFGSVRNRPLYRPLVVVGGPPLVPGVWDVYEGF